MLEALREQPGDVVVVECVEDQPPGPARTDQTEAAEEPQLMRRGGLAQPDQRGKVADAQLSARERVQDADARRITQGPERLGERCREGRRNQRLALVPRGPRDVAWTCSQRSVRSAGVGKGFRLRHEYMSKCSDIIIPQLREEGRKVPEVPRGSRVQCRFEASGPGSDPPGTRHVRHQEPTELRNPRNPGTLELSRYSPDRTASTLA